MVFLRGLNNMLSERSLKPRQKPKGNQTKLHGFLSVAHIELAIDALDSRPPSERSDID